jgi:glutathione S-transferase
MQLIGMLDSPYVRRVAVSLKLMGLPFEHRSLSVFRNFDEFASINPAVKAPSLVCDDGEVLMDSTLILDYLEELAGPSKSLMPAPGAARRHALQIIGLGLVACEKTVQIVYERDLRPAEKRHQPWLDRVTGQLHSAYDQIEPLVARADGWLCDARILQPDITVAVAWRFLQFALPDVIAPARYPAIAAFSTRAEALPEFASTPLD